MHPRGSVSITIMSQKLEQAPGGIGSATYARCMPSRWLFGEALGDRLVPHMPELVRTVATCAGQARRRRAILEISRAESCAPDVAFLKKTVGAVPG